jgi:hypothetical protein
MILYFACKIVEDSLIPAGKESGYFYPVIFPKKKDFQTSSFDIFLKTLDSYSKLAFTSVIFNLDLSEISFSQVELIKEKIQALFGGNRLFLRFSRPNTVKDWLLEIESYRGEIDFNEPVVVALNHDHPWVDYHQNVFLDIVNQVFEANTDVTGRVLYYSHAPEVINWALHGRNKERYTNIGGEIFRCTDGHDWIDSIGVMTMETFSQIWKHVHFDGDYIGRFDWKGVRFLGLELTTYIFPREFFRHYDGYGHTTGLRLNEQLTLNSILPFEFSAKGSNDEIVLFYYQLWKANYLQFIETYLFEHSLSLKTRKTILIEAIQKSIQIFEIAYLEMDYKFGILSESQKQKVLLGLLNTIYFDANSLYAELNTNLKLKSNWLKTPISQFKLFIKYFLRK